MGHRAAKIRAQMLRRRSFLHRFRRIGIPPYMPTRPAIRVTLTAAERHRLKKAAYGHKTPHLARVRAQIVLHAARGRSNAEVSP